MCVYVPMSQRLDNSHSGGPNGKQKTSSCVNTVRLWCEVRRGCMFTVLNLPADACNLSVAGAIPAAA